MLETNITIVVPTYNRCSYLKRLLKYYTETNLKLNIIVADSSTTEFSVINKTICEKYGCNIKYLKFDPNIIFYKKLSLVLNSINTPYTVFNADDDFVLPSGMAECINFLEKNHDYSVAHGIAVFCIVNSQAITSIYPYRQSSICSEKSEMRLISHLSDYTTTFYSIHRTLDIKHNLMRACEFSDKVDSFFGFTELLLSSMSLIQGKSDRKSVV